MARNQVDVIGGTMSYLSNVPNAPPLLRTTAGSFSHFVVRHRSCCYFLAWWLMACGRSFIECRSSDYCRASQTLHAV
jgi:hypothetical protein